MLTNILIFICVLFLSFLSYKYAVGRPKGFPPGPPRIPFFGSYLLMMLSDFTYMHKAVLKFSQWYNSDIVGFYLGPFPVVAAHSARGVREILLNSDFDGRPQIFLAAMRHPAFEIKGIFFKDGPIWKEQRRFMLRHLRDFGFGRRFAELEQVIQDEISEMLDMIRNGPRYPHEKQIVNSNAYRILLPYALSFPSANSFFHIMYNERHSRSEQADLTELVKYIMQFQRLSDDYGKMLTILPWVRHIFPKWSSYDLLMESNKFIYNFFADIVDRHVSSFDKTYERNFLDIYIKQWKQNDGQNNEDISFNREQLIMSLIDFSVPPITAVSTQISLLIQQLLLQPDILKRVQLEIDDVVGSGRLPSLEDRAHLHYTEATIREGMRLDTLVPSDILHKSLVDTELLGYKIPKNTVLVPSLYAYHNDKRVWGDPNVFRPERFLDDDGRFCSKKDLSFPFGAGKRLCAGETFARNMLFLIFVSLCQNFNFVLGPDDKLPDLSKRLSGLIISPRDFLDTIRRKELGRGFYIYEK